VPAVVSSGRYSLRFLLPDTYFFYDAAYDLRTFFSTLQEDFDSMEALRAERRDIDWEQLVDYVEAQPVYVGFPDVELADNRRVQAYYRTVLEPVEKLWALFQQVTRETRNLTRGWSPAFLQARAQSRLGWFEPAVGVDGFREARWREFLDAQWRPRIRELINRHDATRGEKFPRATARLERLLRSLEQLSYLDSQLLYAGLGRPLSPADEYEGPGGIAGSRAILLKMVEDDLAALRPYTQLVPADGEGEGDGEPGAGASAGGSGLPPPAGAAPSGAAPPE
jgi:hypothetical protein